MFGRKKVKKQIKKVDGVVTGLIIGGAVASIFGLSRTKKGKEITNQLKENGKGFFSKKSQTEDTLEKDSSLGIEKGFHKVIGKTLVKISDIFKK